MENEVKTTSTTFEDETSHLAVTDLQRSLLCRRFRALANWSRPNYAGLSGEFESWVTQDEAAVPVRLEAKILIGSVRLELESIQRPGWPPAKLAVNRGSNRYRVPKDNLKSFPHLARLLPHACGRGISANPHEE